MGENTILITSPSLDSSSNVSGIANLTRLLIKSNSRIDYLHFIVGKKDSQKRDFVWLVRNLLLVVRFIRTLLFGRRIKVCHINMPMAPLSIYIHCVLILFSVFFRKKVILHLRGGGAKPKR